MPDSLQTIGIQAFRECGSLAYVSLGSGIVSIGNMAFYKCTSLESVYCG